MLLPFIDRALFASHSKESDVKFYSLTDREKQILSSLYTGLANKQIARNLNISDQTVRHHISKILKKMQVANRTQAIVKAMLAGII